MIGEPALRKQALRSAVERGKKKKPNERVIQLHITIIDTDTD